jgi:hypothetical protein
LFDFSERYFQKVKSEFRPNRGLSLIRPLVLEMCQDNPAKRPTMKEVVPRFEALIGNLPWWKLRSRVIPKNEHIFLRILQFPRHWARQVIAIAKRRPAIPRFSHS